MKIDSREGKFSFKYHVENIEKIIKKVPSGTDIKSQ